MTLFCKISLRTSAIFIIENSQYKSIIKYQENITDKEDLATCLYNLANSTSIFFFGICIFTNSIRWLNIILLQKNFRRMKRASKLLKVVFGISVVFILAIAIFQMVYQCKEDNSIASKYSIVLFVLLTLFLTMFSVSAYIYAGLHFSQTYKLQVAELLI